MKIDKKTLKKLVREEVKKVLKKRKRTKSSRRIAARASLGSQ